MDSPPPPPYTRTRTYDLTKEVIDNIESMHRFLIDSVAFLYGVDHDALKAALPSHYVPCANPDHNEANIPHSTRPSLLCNAEKAETERRAATVSKASDSIAKKRMSLITTAEYWLIYYRARLPAYELNVPETYIFELLSLYAVHKGTAWHEAGMHAGKSWIPFRGWVLKDARAIAMRTVSDMRMIETISPNEHTRTLLATAVAEFGDRHAGGREVELESAYYHSSASKNLSFDLKQDHWRVRIASDSLRERFNG